MPDTVTVTDLSDFDVLADVAALIGGADTIDGIEIEGCEYDEGRGQLFITLTDVDGNSKTATFDHIGTV